MIDDRSAQSIDIAMIVDPRFSGGTISALESDVVGFTNLGAKVGILPVRSAFLSDATNAVDPRLDALYDKQGVVRLAPGRPIKSELAFFHHPLTFFFGVDVRTPIAADLAVIVAHHPPFRGDGSLEYDPIATGLAVRRTFGVWPRFAPVSGIVRRQLRSFAPLVQQTREDWPNTFDVAQFTPKRRAFGGDKIVVGRHGRADPLKWPDTGTKINASLPVSPATRIRVMGCPVSHVEELGAHTSSWEILEFNAEPVLDFLEALDVFSYFHSDRWVESFGRTIAEAALMGAVCILDRRLETNFGPIGIYCNPEEVADVVARLGGDVAGTRCQAASARLTAIDRFAQASLERRWHSLRADAGDRRRTADVHTSLPKTLRKVGGLYKRRLLQALRD